MQVRTEFRGSGGSPNAAAISWCIDVGNNGLMSNLPDFSQLCPLHPVGHVHPVKRLQTPPFWHLQLSLQSGPYMSLGQADKRKRNLWCVRWQTQRKGEDIFHTYVFHSVCQTSRWRRSSRRGLGGKNEALCSSGRSHMIVGSFGQTFLLCRLQRAENSNSQMLLFRWLLVLWSNG